MKRQLKQIIKNPKPQLINPLLGHLTNSPAPQTALFLYNQMLRYPTSHNHYTFTYALKACCFLHDDNKGREVQARVVKTWHFSDTFIRFTSTKAAIPRPLWNASSQILMAVGYILMAIAMPGSLYIGSIVVGICYGIRLAVTVPTASELFGLKYYGLIYNILILNLPLGSFLFSGLLAGLLYDMEATTTEGGGNTCVGAHCYRLVFVIMAIACVIGFGLDILLSIRTKNLYTRIQAGKKTRRVVNGTQ